MANPLNKFKKDIEKMKDVTTNSAPPKYWLSTGFYIINKTITGSYDKGYASSRVSMLTGPSSAGKSFMAIQSAVEAQNMGYIVFIVDSEHALDDNYMKAVGLDVNSETFFYNDVKSLEAAKKVTAAFINMYRDNKDELPPALILIDSMDQLKTKTHVEKSEKGEVHNDQGQHAKQLKQFAADIAHEIKSLDIFCIMTKQPYKNQDPIMAKVQPYIITDAMRFPFSQIILLTNRRLKDKTTKKVEGIALKVFAEKTRFTKPFQSCVVDIPYDSPIDPYSGALEAAENIGIIKKTGAWYDFEGNKFQERNSNHVIEEIYNKLREMDEDENVVLEFGNDEEKDEK